MIHSETIEKLAAAIVKAQGELEHVAKDANNPHFKSKYADLPSVVDTIRPVYAKHGLAVLQGFVPDDSGVTIETRIIHSSGQWISDEGLHLPIDKQNAQGVGSAITYGRRYTLLAMSGVAPDDDDDGNAASANTGSKPASKTQHAKPNQPSAHPATPHAKLVSADQAKELEAAAIANGVDPALAARKAKQTKATDFVTALKKLKGETN